MNMNFNKIVCLDLEWNDTRCVTEVGLVTTTRVLLDELVRPDRAGHGHLRGKDFSKARDTSTMLADLSDKTHGMAVIGYNVAGDLNVINAQRHERKLAPWIPPLVIDVMRIYRGVRKRASWGDHSLTDVLRVEGILTRPGNAHRAAWDAQHTLMLFQHYVKMFGPNLCIKLGLVRYEYEPQKENRMNKKPEFKATTPRTLCNLGPLLYQGTKDVAPRQRNIELLALGNITWNGKPAGEAFEVYDRDANSIRHMKVDRFLVKSGTDLKAAFLATFK